MGTLTKITRAMGLTAPLIALMLMPSVARSSVITATASGSWSSSATWGGQVPSPTVIIDQIIIPAGIEVLMDTDVTLSGPLASLQVNGVLQGSANALIVAAGTVAGTGQMVLSSIDLGIGASMTFSGQVQTATFISSAASLAMSAATTVSSQLQLNAGAVLISAGSLELGNGAQIIVNGGSMSLSGGAFIATQGYTVIYQGGSGFVGIEASGPGLQGVELSLSSPTQQIALSGNLTLNGDLTVSQGVFAIGNHSLTVNGSINVAASGALASTSQSSLTVNTGSSGNADLVFIFSPETIGNLTINAGNGASVQLQGELWVAGSFALQSGQLGLGSGAVLGLSGQASFGSGAVIGGSPSAGIVIATDGSVGGSLAFASGSSTIGNLTIAIGNGGSVALGSDATVSGTLDLQNGFIALGASDLTVSGSISGGSSSSYVVTNGDGSLILGVAAGGAGVIYPVGTAVHFCPATLAQAAGSASGAFGVSAMAGVLAQGTAGANMADFTSVVDASWMVMAEASASADIDLTMTVEWAAQQAVNAFNAMQCYISHYTEGAWDVYASAQATVNAEGRFEVSRSGITSLSPFAVFDGNTAVGVPMNQALTFSLYPNPATEALNYSLSNISGQARVELYDLSGKMVISQHDAGRQCTLGLHGLPAGVYTVKVVDDSGVSTSRIVRQ